MKRLNELFNIDNDMKIYSIHSDSRYVKPYSIFFCIEGLSVDGHRYVDDAIFQGAKVIVHSKDIEKQPGIIYIKVADALDELNRVSNVFYDYPSKKMRVVGVTGTSGKTVVASMVKSVMDHYCKAAYMGTISLEYDGVEEQCPYTTPETLYVQKKLFDMAIIKENIEYEHHMKYGRWQDKGLYEELYEVICEIVCVKHKTVKIGGNDYPYELVKSKFLKLNSSHLEYVIGCMQETTTKIANIKAYMVTALYNVTIYEVRGSVDGKEYHGIMYGSLDDNLLSYLQKSRRI